MTIGGETFLDNTIEQKVIDDWWEQFASGRTVTDISREYGYCRTTIAKHLKQHPLYKNMAKRNMNTKTERKPYLQSRFRRNIFVYKLDGTFVERVKLSSFNNHDKECIYRCAIGRMESYNNRLYCFGLLSKKDMKLMYERFETNRKNKISNFSWYRYYKIS